MPRTASVFRDVIDSGSERLTLMLPREFANRRLAVIVLPLDEPSKRSETVSADGGGWPPGYFDRLMGSVPDFPDSDLIDPLDPVDALAWDTERLDPP